MSTTARLDDLKRDLARLERKRTGQRGAELGRGREAAHPGQIPSRGWMDVLWRAWGEVGEANLFLIAGGVTYALILALFPGLAALVSLYGLIFDPSQVEKQIGVVSGILPAETQQLLSQQLHSLVQASGKALGFGAIVVALIGVVPAAAQFLAVGVATKWLLLLVQWPLLVVLMMFGLAVLYRYAPDRDKAQWRWVSPGAIAATILWIIASIGFTVYVANFNSYDKTYGSLGGVVILLNWLYLSTLVVLFGAAINTQSEKQTRQDTTAGAPRPMGQRDARAADTL